MSPSASSTVILAVVIIVQRHRVMYLAMSSGDVLQGEAAVAICCDTSITKGNPGICQPVILVMIHIRQLVPSTAKGDVGGALVQVVNTLFVEYVASSSIGVHMAGQHQVHIVEVEEGLQAVPQVVCSQPQTLRQTAGREGSTTNCSHSLLLPSRCRYRQTTA